MSGCVMRDGEIQRVSLGGATIKNLDDVDHKILKKFKSLNKNLEEIEELIEFQTIIEKIAEQMKLDSDLILQKYYYYKKLKII